MVDSSGKPIILLTSKSISSQDGGQSMEQNITMFDVRLNETLVKVEGASKLLMRYHSTEISLHEGQ